jgi:hypothetical protein
LCGLYIGDIAVVTMTEFAYPRAQEIKAVLEAMEEV